MGETLNLIELVSGGFPSYFGLRPNEFLRIVVAEAVLTLFKMYVCGADWDVELGLFLNGLGQVLAECWPLHRPHE